MIIFFLIVSSCKMTLFTTTLVMHGAHHAARTVVGVSISLQAGFEFRVTLLLDSLRTKAKEPILFNLTLLHISKHWGRDGFMPFRRVSVKKWTQLTSLEFKFGLMILNLMLISNPLPIHHLTHVIKKEKTISKKKKNNWVQRSLSPYLT